MSTKYQSDGMPKTQLVMDQLDAVRHGGKVHVNVCKYTGTGAEVAGDIIQLCALPKGAKLLTPLCWVNGNQAATTAYLTGYTAAAGSALNAFSQFGVNASNKDEDLLAADTVLTATLVGGGITSGNVIYFGIVYLQL